MPPWRGHVATRQHAATAGMCRACHSRACHGWPVVRLEAGEGSGVEAGAV